MAEAEQQRTAFRFGPFELDARAGELRKHGVRLKLQEQPLHILLLLLERAGDVVTREEIQRRLWQDSVHVDFDNAINSAVRKLRDALGDSAESSRFIETLARRGYRFIAPVSTLPGRPPTAVTSEIALVARDEAVESRKPGRRAAILIITVVIAMVAAAVGLKLWLTDDKGRGQPELQVTPFTSYTGDEVLPSFSPDGSRVVFAWRRSNGSNFRLFVKQIGSGDPMRLTDGSDTSPAWSPDGNYIAFFRQTKDRDHPALMIMPALGGQPRQLATVSSRGISWVTPPWQCWSADSKWLFTGTASEKRETTELVRISIETGEMQRVLAPADNTFGDGSLAMSPDGRTLAFVRTITWDVSDIYLLAISKRQEPSGPPHRVTFDRKRIYGLAWTADGRDLVFPSNRGASGMMQLWRVAAFGPHRPTRVAGVDDQMEAVTVAREAGRLVFSKSTREADIWRMPLDTNAKVPPALFLSSTRYENNAQYSPDGQRIAFESDRSGTEEVWVAKADGTNAVQLTSMRAWSGSPNWSWDGEKIAFDSNAGGGFNIYIVNANGGKPQRVTFDEANNVRPNWSHDGHWIYYSSRRSGGMQFWKVAPAGTPNIQVTKNGSDLTARVSADGEELYYTKDQALWKVPVLGGQETKVSPSVCADSFSASKRGIYFADCSNGALDYLNFRTRAIEVLPKAPAWTLPMSVSPDGRWLLYTRDAERGSDLMLVDNFH